MIRWTYLPTHRIPESIRRHSRTPLMGAYSGDDLLYVVTLGATPDPEAGWPVVLWVSDGSGGTYSILDSVVGTFGYDPKRAARQYWKPTDESPEPEMRFVLAWAEKVIRQSGDRLSYR